MTPANVEHLEEHGPSTLAELPRRTVGISDRRNGVWKFDVTGSTHGDSDPLGGRTDAVYYLHGEHDRSTVVEKYLEANPRIVEAKTRHGLRLMLNRHGTEWSGPVNQALKEAGP